MKHFLFLIIFSSVLCSCSNHTGGSAASADSASVETRIPVESFNGNIPVNTPFPFGDTALSRITYMKNWDEDPNHYGQLKQPAGRSFENIGKYFQKLNGVKTIRKPEFKNVTFIKGNNYDLSNEDTAHQPKVDSCRYRLPDIGKYECYYFYQQNKASYGSEGNLLLIDKTTANGKLLNIYYEAGGEADVLFRYFLMNNNQLVIYEGACYDDGCSLEKKFSIGIAPSGEISVNPVKQGKR